MSISTRQRWLLSGLMLGLAGAAYALALPPASPPWRLYLLDGRPVAAARLGETGAGFSSAAAWSVGSLPAQLSGSGTFRCPLTWRIRSWVHVIATLLHCDNATARVELRYLSLLSQVTYFETAGSRLYLYDAAHPQPLLGFSRRAGAAPLAAAHHTTHRAF